MLQEMGMPVQVDCLSELDNLAVFLLDDESMTNKWLVHRYIDHCAYTHTDSEDRV